MESFIPCSICHLPPHARNKFLFLCLALITILFNVQCKKQITDDAVPPPTPPQRIDVLALIDSLQNTGFFINNRANPDA